MPDNIIKALIKGALVEIDLDNAVIHCVTNLITTSVELCIEVPPDGELLPFAKIKLYDDYRYLSAFKTLDDAAKLGNRLINSLLAVKQTQPIAGTHHE